MEEGGIDALLMLLQSCQNITILRVASGAIANLAMNGIQNVLFLFVYFIVRCVLGLTVLTVLLVKGYIFHQISSDQINNAAPPSH